MGGGEEEEEEERVIGNLPRNHVFGLGRTALRVEGVEQHLLAQCHQEALH